jgi:selenium-binding protein 1
MKQFGNAVVVWDFHARKPIQTLAIAGAPLELRWALQPRHNYAFTTAALTSKIWLVEQQPDGAFKATDVATIGDPKTIPLAGRHQPLRRRPLPLRRHVQRRDVPHLRRRRSPPPEARRPAEDRHAGQHGVADMGRRAPLLHVVAARELGQEGKDGEQYLAAYRFDGKKLAPLFRVDFLEAKLGRPHIMNFGQDQFYKNQSYAAGETRAVAAR